MADPKQKLECEAKQEIRNWLEIPSDVMTDILNRVDAVDILENAQKVCTTWRNICKDPAIWKVIHMKNYPDPSASRSVKEMHNLCKHAVDRSQGQLVDISIFHFATDELLYYIADRSSQLRCLEIVCIGIAELEGLKDALKKLPLLEELNLYKIKPSKEAIETVGRYCPMLRTLRVSQEGFRYWPWDDGLSKKTRNQTAIAIGENLHELWHLELIENNISNYGLQVILDGCPHLELLDLRLCVYIDLSGDIGKKCSEKIKCLKLPNDSLEGCLYYLENLSYESDSDSSDDW